MSQSTAFAPATPGPATVGSPSQVLCFELAGQSYAVDILVVREIRRFTPATALPDVPRYMLGVINLRGAVVPVFDLRLRFGVGGPEVDRNTAVIVVAVGARQVGLVVDVVTRVLDVAPEARRPAPLLANSVDASFLRGLIAVGDRLITWLDVECLMRGELEAA